LIRAFYAYPKKFLGKNNP